MRGVPATRGDDAASLPDARTLSPGARLGRYVVSHRVARGGMAELYLARATGADGFAKTVALKLVLPHLKDDADFMAMFRNEARIAARLDHPNIAQVFDLGMDRNEYFIAMEYVHGVSVATLLRKIDGPAPLECTLGVVAGACEALHYAHELPAEGGRRETVVHRDVSPGNVLVRHDGIVKLVDFGIAKALSGTKQTRTGTIKGKAGYMSPEQCRGQELDRRTDIYCLGIMLYELATGQRAFSGHSDFTIMNAIISGDYTRPTEVDSDFDPALEAIIVRALATDREERYATARELRADLAKVATEHGLELGSEGPRAVLDDVFGDLALPELQSEPTEPDQRVGDGVLTTVDAVRNPVQRPRAPIASYALVAVLAGGGVWAAINWNSSEPIPGAPAAVDASPKRDEDPVAATPVQSAEPPIAKPESKAAAKPETPLESPVETEPEVRPRASPRPSTKRKRRPRPAAADSDERSVEGDNDLRPPSMRE